MDASRGPGCSGPQRFALTFFRLSEILHPIAIRDTERSSMQYFVVMIDYGRRGREAIVDPEMTRRDVVARVVSGEYTNISFIHEVVESSVEDVTGDILAEANLPEEVLTGSERQAAALDHIRDLRKHEPA